MADLRGGAQGRAQNWGAKGPPLTPCNSVPRGGGAIGEKFSVGVIAGTGSLSVPAFTSPGRFGFSPQFSLSYDSGSGTGPFGLGWNLSVAAITRKTDRGIHEILFERVAYGDASGAARGGSGTSPAGDAGWFFVIEERPGEPRFGLDVQRTGALEVWNDLAWPDVVRDASNHIDFDNTLTRTLTACRPQQPVQQQPPQDSEKNAQHAEDCELTWHARMSSADVAYILFHVPVRVAVHAREMLRHEQPQQ